MGIETKMVISIAYEAQASTLLNHAADDLDAGGLAP